MAISLLQAVSQNDNSAGTTSSVSFSVNVAAGSLLVLTIVWTPRVNNVTVDDNRNGAWAPWSLGKQTNNNSELSNIEFFFFSNAAAGPTTVTVHYSATGNFGVWSVAEFNNGVAGGWTPDQVAVTLTASASTTPASGNTGTLSQADELAVGCAGTVRSDSTYAAGTGWAIPSGGTTSGNAQSESMEWDETNSTAAVNAQFTMGTNSTWNAGCMTFIPPVSGGGSTVDDGAFMTFIVR